MKVVNKFDPSGIEQTLRNWYDDPTKQTRWVLWDGVSVSLVPRLEHQPEHVRSICKVHELSSVFGSDAHLTIGELLNNDF